MPMHAPRICACGKTVAHRQVCECQRARKQARDRAHDAKRPSSSARGYTSEWERESKAYLSRRENRQCKWPGCTAEAKHVDHVTPHAGNQRLFWNRSNWQGLCAHHHNSSKQKAERRAGHTGGW